MLVRPIYNCNRWKCQKHIDFKTFSPRPAKTGHFVILLCLMPGNITCQGRASGWERVKTQPEPVVKKWNSQGLWLEIEPATSGSLVMLHWLSCRSCWRELGHDPEVMGTIPSRRPWSCIFHNLSRLSLKMYIFSTLKFTAPYFDFHLLTTSVNNYIQLSHLSKLLS